MKLWIYLCSPRHGGMMLSLFIRADWHAHYHDTQFWENWLLSQGPIYKDKDRQRPPDLR